MVDIGVLESYNHVFNISTIKTLGMMVGAAAQLGTN